MCSLSPEAAGERTKVEVSADVIEVRAGMRNFFRLTSLFFDFGFFGSKHLRSGTSSGGYYFIETAETPA